MGIVLQKYNPHLRQLNRGASRQPRAQKNLNTYPVAFISPIRYIQMGVPEWQNVQAAQSLCRTCGISDGELNRGLETFRKPAHRIEYVGAWNGISFYNDSKVTNIDAVMHAIKLFEGPIVLIVGGVDKGGSY